MIWCLWEVFCMGAGEKTSPVSHIPGLCHMQGWGWWEPWQHMSWPEVLC